MKPEKYLFIVRHAHRDTTNKMLDNGLSEKGRGQSKKIRDSLSRELGEDQVIILSSPKARCIETLEPLAEALGIEIEIDPKLDEHGPSETTASFRERTKIFAEFIGKKKFHRMVICSHGDWIPEFTAFILGKGIDLEKAGMIELRYFSKAWHLNG